MTQARIARARLNGGPITYLAALGDEPWRNASAMWTGWSEFVAAAAEGSFPEQLLSCPLATEDDWHYEIPFEPPARFYGIALNYASRAAQVRVSLPASPFVFTKEPSSLLPDGAEVVLPADLVAALEGEVGAVVTAVTPESVRADAWVAINDMTFPARLGPPPGDDWFAGKNHPSTTTLGPWLVVASGTESLRFPDEQWTVRNGSICQRASVDDLHHPVAAVLDYLACHVQLVPGDVVSMGTPRTDLDGRGQKPLEDGDVVEVHASGLPPAHYAVSRLR